MDMMKFKFDQLETIDLEQVTLEEGRYYVSPNGDKLRSVTTLLGELTDTKAAIDAWRARVGEEQANKVMIQAQRRGTAIHDAVEQYLNNSAMWKAKLMPVNLETVNNIIPHLNENVNLIYGIEHRLYSDELQAAGTADLICQWNGINTIVDFKTSKRIKTEDDIENYFLQSSAYAYMMKECYDMDFPQIVIVMAIDHEETRVFVQESAQHIINVKKLFKR